MDLEETQKLILSLKQSQGNYHMEQKQRLKQLKGIQHDAWQILSVTADRLFATLGLKHVRAKKQQQIYKGLHTQKQACVHRKCEEIPARSCIEKNATLT